MLRSISAGMPLMWDRGFHDYEMFQLVRQRRAHALARLSALIQPEYIRTLSDGSRLAYLYPAGYRRKKHPERLLIRVIEYTIGDPARNGSHEVHRVVTTLLNPRIAPALEVVIAYHERWEIEITIDEIDIHQRLVSFVHTIRLVQAAIPEVQMTHAEDIPLLVARLVHDIGKERLPGRRHRCNPRVVKHKMSDFPLERLEHLQPPKPRGPFREAVLLI